VVKYDIKAAVPCLLYLYAILIAVCPQGDETTWWENIFLPGEVQYSEASLIETISC
jgi:hypothetical protein